MLLAAVEILFLVSLSSPLRAVRVVVVLIYYAFCVDDCFCHKVDRKILFTLREGGMLEKGRGCGGQGYG